MKLRDCLRRAEHTPGRWLMWCALGFTLSTLAACYVLPDGQLLPAALLCAMLILPCLALRGNVRVRAVLLCLFAALGFARYAGYLRTAVAPAEANEEEGWRTARDFFLGLFIGFGVAVAVLIIGGIIVNYSIN